MNNLNLEKSEIKVLWFCTSMANSDEYFKSELTGTGGWQKALDRLLQNKVELHVAYYKQHDDSFKYGNTYYYPIKTNQSILSRLIKRLTKHVVDQDDLKKYLDIINYIRPDIIHIHGTENSFASLVPFTNIPVVVSVQGLMTVIVHKYFSGLEKKYSKITNLSFSNLRSLVFPKDFLVVFKRFSKMAKIERRNLKSVKYVIGRTNWDERIVKLLAPNSLYFRGDEILRDEFYKHEWVPPKNDRFIIHTTNDNVFFKGFETICLALSELNKLGFNCEWQVAGIEANDLIVKITKNKLKNNYPDRGLILKGKNNDINLIKLMLKADVFVLTSHIENSPNSLCEAMLIGMPCVATFVGGVGSLIKDGENGLLIQDGDPWSLAGAVLELANNKDKAIQLGKNAKKNALVRHDKDTVVEELIEVYQKILLRAQH